MPSRVFTIDELETNPETNPYEAEWSDEGWDTRWYKHQNVVFRAKDDGKLYHLVYRNGLTENQECYGHERYPYSYYNSDMKTWTLECPEVELYEEMVPVTKFRKVTDA